MSNFPPPPPPGGGQSPLPPPSAPRPAATPTSATPPAAPAPPPYQPPLGYQPNAPEPAPKSGWQKTVAGIPVWLLASVAVIAVVAVVAVVAMGGDDDKNNIAAATSTIAPDGSTPGDTVATTPSSGSTGDTTTDSSTPDTTIGEPSGDEIAGAPPGAKGTADDPVAAGQIADIGGGWRLQVLEVVPDATAEIIEDSFNEPPPEGSAFTTVKVALGYYGLEDPAFSFEPLIQAIGSTETELDNFCGFLPGEISLFLDVFSGGVITGNLCFVTTAADRDGMRLRATGDYFAPEEIYLEVAPAPGASVMPTLDGPQAGAAATPGRLDPLPLGTAEDVGEDWSIIVTGPARDITAELTGDIGFNDPPPEGYSFIGIDVTYTNNGSDTDTGFTITASAVGDSNVEFGSDCYPDDSLDIFDDVPAGGSISGTLCFVAPTGATGLVLYATAGFDAPDPKFFAVS